MGAIVAPAMFLRKRATGILYPYTHEHPQYRIRSPQTSGPCPGRTATLSNAEPQVVLAVEGWKGGGASDHQGLSTRSCFG